MFEAPEGARAPLHLSESGWGPPVIQPMQIFTFEAFFSKSLLIAQKFG
jgi:hypothetical protein